MTEKVLNRNKNGMAVLLGTILLLIFGLFATIYGACEVEAGRSAFMLVLGIVIALLLAHFLPGQPLLVLAATLLCVLPVAGITIRAQLQAMLSLFRALSGTVASYQDGDFGFSLRWPQNDELADLVAAHNALGDVLRKQRLDLVQR